MPYKGPADTSLPANVKKLPIGARRKWVTTWNSAFAQCQKDGGEDCEGHAFEIANGTIEEQAQELELPLGQFEFRLRRLIADKVGGGRYVQAVFLGHPEFGDAAVIEEEWRLWMAPFSLNEDGTDLEVSARSEWAEVYQTYKLIDAPLPEMEEPATEEAQAEEAIAEVAESISGHVVGIVEGSRSSDGDALVIDIIPIMPGWGNRRDNFYYPKETVINFAHIWEGAKMYTTDHRADEKSVRTEVSQVLKCPVGFTEDGVPIARVGIFDPTFAKMVNNRAKLGVLDGLHCSIYGSATAEGKFSDGEREGRKIVAFHPEGANIDWVTQAGAGGRALRIPQLSEGNMKPEEEATAEVLEEVKIKEEALADDEESIESETEAAGIETEQAGSQESPSESLPALTKEDVISLVEKVALPEVAKTRLLNGTYADTAEAQGAIDAEVQYIKEITNSGKPVLGSGGTSGPIDPAVIQEKQSAVNNRWFNRQGRD